MNNKRLNVGDRVEVTDLITARTWVTNNGEKTLVAEWPEGVTMATVTEVKRYWEHRTVEYWITPDAPGFGLFYRQRHSMKLIERKKV